MNERVIRCAKALATTLERLLAFGILLGVVVFAFQSTIALTGMDWRSTEVFYELMYRVLLLVIGVELIRTLVTHDLMAVLELLAFVVAQDAEARTAHRGHSFGRRSLCGPTGCASIPASFPRGRAEAGRRREE